MSLKQTLDRLYSVLSKIFRMTSTQNKLTLTVRILAYDIKYSFSPDFSKMLFPGEHSAMLLHFNLGQNHPVLRVSSRKIFEENNNLNYSLLYYQNHCINVLQSPPHTHTPAFGHPCRVRDSSSPPLPSLSLSSPW